MWFHDELLPLKALSLNLGQETTMSIPFGNSIRSLRSEREWSALAILISAILLLVLWLGWFFWAPILVYETGEVVGATRDGTLLASFSASASDRLRPGQLAMVHTQFDSEQNATDEVVPVMVMLVNRSGTDSSRSDSEVVVELSVISDRWLNLDYLTTDPDPVRVEVEVGQISPAQWVLNISGQWIEAPSVRLRPQSLDR
jgi:hypothetical protein